MDNYYNINQLLDAAKRLLSSVNQQLGINTTNIETAFYNVDDAINTLHEDDLKAMIDYYLTLEELFGDDEWADEPTLKNFPN